MKVPIQFVVDTFNHGKIKATTASKMRCDCPLCQGRQTLGYTLGKDIWHCFKCDEKGNPVDLYAKVNGLDKKTATRQLNQLYGGTDTSEYEKPVEEEMILPASFYVRDAVYRDLLKQLGLSKKHKKDLLTRGLTPEEIEMLGYKTFATSDNIAKKSFTSFLAQKNFEFIERNVTKEVGVPGFYDLGKEIPKLVKARSGYLIPVRNFSGYISGFQIRYDRPIDDNKYGWLSSGHKKTGVSFDGQYCCNIQHSGPWKEYLEKMPEVVGLTEGALKADIASVLYDKLDQKGRPHLFLGLTGVSNTAQLRAELENCYCRGVKRISVYVDMDYHTNPNVKKAMDKIVDIIKSVDLEVKVQKWNPAYKGIDDYLLAELKRKEEEAKSGKN